MSRITNHALPMEEERNEVLAEGMPDSVLRGCRGGGARTGRGQVLSRSAHPADRAVLGGGAGGRDRPYRGAESVGTTGSTDRPPQPRRRGRLDRRGARGQIGSGRLYLALWLLGAAR